MDTVEERPYTPRNRSVEDVSSGTKTDLPADERLPGFRTDLIDDGIATPRYAGVNVGALEAQEDLAQFSRVHRVYPAVECISDSLV